MYLFIQEFLSLRRSLALARALVRARSLSLYFIILAGIATALLYALFLRGSRAHSAASSLVTGKVEGECVCLRLTCQRLKGCSDTRKPAVSRICRGSRQPAERRRSLGGIHAM